MSWIFLVLASHFSWAIENVYTKIVIGSKVKNPYVFLILIMVLSVTALPFVPYHYIFFPTVSVMGWLLLASALYTLGTLPYIKAMKIEEVTRLNILWNTIPIFTLILGWLLIGDKISGRELMAMLFLISGAVIASLKNEASSFKLSKAFWPMIVACILYSAYAVVVRFLTKELSFYSIFFWTTLFNALMVLVCLGYREVRNDLIKDVKNSSIKFFLIFLIVVVISNIGTFLNQWALSIKSGSLVYSFEGFQVLFVFFLSLVAAKIFPGFIAESLDKKDLIIKFVAFLIVMVGLILLM